MKGRAVLAVMGAMLCNTLHAAQLQVEVRIEVQRGCQLVGTTRSAGIEQLGVLDFGSGPRLDDAAGPLSAALISQRHIDFVVRAWVKRNGMLPGRGVIALSVLLAIVKWPVLAAALWRRV